MVKKKTRFGELQHVKSGHFVQQPQLGSVILCESAFILKATILFSNLVMLIFRCGLNLKRQSDCGTDNSCTQATQIYKITHEYLKLYWKQNNQYDSKYRVDHVLEDRHDDI